MNTGYTNLTNKNQKDIQLFRNSIEVIRNRAELLDEPDKTLLITYLDNENSFRQIAKLIGVNEATVSRRIKKIIRRLENNTVKLTHKNIQTLDDSQRKIARDYFIKGISRRKISKKYHLPYYKVRKIIRIVETTTSNRSCQVSERKY